MKNYTINLINGKSKCFKSPQAFMAGVIIYNVNSKKIKYLGWSDGYNACGYKLDDIFLDYETSQDWRKIALKIIDFAKKFKGENDKN